MTKKALWLSQKRGRALVALALIFSVLLSSIGLAPESLAYDSAPAPETEPAEHPEPEKQPKQVNNPKLQLEINEGQAGGEAHLQVKAAVCRPLAPQRVERIIERLPVWNVAAAQPFSFPEQSVIKPELPGTVKTEAFPPGGQSPAGGKGEAFPDSNARKVIAPLTVLRFSPQGKVKDAGTISITFSQPMVPVGSVDAVNDRMNVPVILKPEPAGKWRWVGTQTLLFEPDGGLLPRATNYTVKVPQTTKSMSGNSLKDGKSLTWTISTPAPSVTQFHPSGGTHGPAPLMVATFDQRIDAASSIKAVKLTAGGSVRPVRLATAEEIKQDVQAGRLTKDKKTRGMWLAFKSVAPLPRPAPIKVAVGPGVVSSEGPLRSTQAQMYQYKTYGNFELAVIPRSPVSPESWESREFEFSNQIESKQFKPSMVALSPPAPGSSFIAAGNKIYLNGRLKARTRYTLNFDAKISDQFGQPLGGVRKIAFTTGDFEPALDGPSESMAIIPFGLKPVITCDARGITRIRASVYKVGPPDFDLYKRVSRGDSWEAKGRAALKTKLASQRVLPADVTGEKPFSLDLSPYLKGGLGNVVVVLESLVPNPDLRRRQIVWVQVTSMGIDAFHDGDTLVAQVSQLKDARPVQGVDLQLVGQKSAPRPSGAKATTGAQARRSGIKSDAKGLARIALNGAASSMLVARLGNDTAFLPYDDYQNLTGWTRVSRLDCLRWFGVTDRQLYRPGEAVNLKGWLRRAKIGEAKELIILSSGAKEIEYKVVDHQYLEIARGKAAVDAFGGFALKFDVPKNVRLGSASIELKSIFSEKAVAIDPGSQKTSIPFDIQEFRKPEFEMSVSSSQGTNLSLGQKTNLTATARYYAGGPLTNAPIDWSIRSEKGHYSPPGWSEFTFGEEPSLFPWLRSDDFNPDSNVVRQISGITDSAGEHRLDLRVSALARPLPLSLSLEATAYDVNRQSWSQRMKLLIHPADFYAGLKLNRYFYKKGDEIECRFILTDADGKPAANRRLSVRVTREVVDRASDKTKDEVVEELMLPSSAEPGLFKFTPQLGGRYKIVAAVRDDSERISETIISTWVQDESTFVTKNVEEQTAYLIADKKEYSPGDVCEIMVMSPFSKAKGLMTLRRAGLASVEHIELASSSGTIRLALKEEHIPNLTVNVDLAGANGSFASGSLDVPVSARKRELRVDLTPSQPALSPGGKTSVAVTMKDKSGRPVEGQVALAVVDESILALAGYKWPDPMSVFYADISPEVSERRSRQYVILPSLEKPEPHDKKGGMPSPTPSPQAAELAALPSPSALPPPPVPGAAPHPGKRAPFELLAAAPPPPPLDETVTVRKFFHSLALFAPGIVTGADGRATVDLELPDNLTRYRIMAVAVKDWNKFGSAESAVTARLPLMIKPSPPRFLNFGDRCELPVVLQNQTDKAIAAEVVAQTNNAFLIDSLSADSATLNRDQSSESDFNTPARGYLVDVPANDRVEIRFPVATDQVGMARFRFAAMSPGASDAAEAEFKVMMPASLESFAAYGVLDGGAQVQTIERPDDVFPEIGGLSISTSSTALQSLTDAFFYLKEYDLNCSEQISSRVLAVLSLQDVLQAFSSIKNDDLRSLREQTQKDIEILEKRQNADGSFGLWKAGESQTWPYLTAQVCRALNMAGEKKYRVTGWKLERGKSYLKEIRTHFPKNYSDELNLSTEAYALYVRHLMRDSDPAGARRLFRSLRAKSSGAGSASVVELPLEAASWLLAVMSKDAGSASEATSLRNLIGSRMKETASTASAESGGYGGLNYCLFYSPRRTDAVVLEALIQDQPKSDLIPKLARGLIGHKKKGKWEGTQENACVLLALEKYFSTYEKTNPDFVTTVFLGDTFAGRTSFKGRSAETTTINLPMELLARREKKEDLLVTRNGAGRLYYRVGLDYAPLDLELKPSYNGFRVTRKYEAVDDEADVTRAADGTWKVRAGATVRVKLEFQADSARYHVALLDPLPGGFEAVNAELKGTRKQLPRQAKNDEREAQDRLTYLPDSDFHFWLRSWFDHQNLRDHQSEAFASLLWGGSYSYTYTARATTPGRYIVPPPKVEEMYAPETFGRGETARVIVE